MNMLDIQDKLKGLSEQQLVQAMQAPTENIPQFLVLSEITRRKRMRDSMQQQDNGATVAEEAVAAAGVPQGGIADMARALAPKTDMTQNTGASPVQGMYGGGYVQKMAAGDLIVKDGKRYIEQDDGSYLGEDGIPVDLDLTVDDRTFGQRYIGDPLRDLFKPIGESMRETLKPVGESMRDTMQPVGADLAQVLKGRPEEGYSFVPPSDPRLVPQPLTYDQIIARARSGSMPSSDQLQSSVEAGLLTGQQASDVQSMIEGGGYIPDSQEIAAAKAPGLSPVVPDDPRMVTDPYRLTSVRTRAGQTIDDYVSGILGDRTVGDQAAIDAARKEAIEETVAAPQGLGPAFERRGREQSPTDALEAIAAQTAAAEASKAAEDAAKRAAASDATAGGTRTSGGAGGVGSASGATSYEQELINAMQRAERRAEQDKWLALAQIGLGLMSSTQPTFGGALGEAGLAGLQAYQGARDEYETERLGLSKELAGIEAARASQRAASAKARSGPSIKDISDRLQLITTDEVDPLTGSKTGKRVPISDKYAGAVAQYEQMLLGMMGAEVAPTM